MNELLGENFSQFLIEAKKQTYASDSNNAAVENPLFAGSTQLDWRRGNLLYRDVYFGSAFFVGLETVIEKNKPKWAMSYSGGMIEGIQSDDVGPTYAFLKLALAQVQVEKPFRGPEVFEANELVYRMKSKGGIDRFSGKEEIFFRDVLFYELVFSGGWIGS